MVIIKDKGFMDGYIKANLDIAKGAVAKDFDMVFCVDGMEGSGKSVVAQQLALYCDPTLNIDRVAFTADEFHKAVLNAKQYQAVIFDEAYTGLSSRQTMSKVNKALVEMLAEIRQKNLFIFVVMPTFFDLDKYVALWRSRGLFHIYLQDGFKRGQLAFYNIDRKKSLYVEGKKYYNYNMVKPNFIARFGKWYAVPEEEYRKKKRESLGKKDSDNDYDPEFDKKVKEEIFKRLKDRKDISNVLKAEVIGISENCYYEWIKKHKDDLLGI